MEESGKLTELAVSELLEALSAPPVAQESEIPERLVSILAHPEEAPLPPGESIVSWLASLYRHGEPGLRERLRSNLLAFLSDPLSQGVSDEALARALALVEEARIQEAVDPIRKLVTTRKLVEIFDGIYSDLHGRALRALFILGELDPVECLEQELPFREYVPLAFAFVRERAKDRLPEILPRLATFDFFPEALRTVVLTYPEERLKLLRGAAEQTVKTGEADRIAAFLEAIHRLPITASEREELSQILHPERPPAIDVLVRLEDKILERVVVESLRQAGFDARSLSVDELQRAVNPVLVTSARQALPDIPHATMRQQSIYHFEVFRQGDPYASTGELSMVIPRLAGPHEMAIFIRERLLHVRQLRRWVLRMGLADERTVQARFLTGQNHR